MEQFEDIKKYENKEELGLGGVETLSDLIGNMEELESIGISRMCELIYSRQLGMKEDDIKSKVSYSSYKTKLNKMFYGLFDKGYKEVLNGDKNKNEYKIYKNGKIFIFFLFDTFKNQSMKNIRDNNYNDIDRNYENYLLYYACEFLKERKLHEMENDIPTEELLKTLFEKFNLNNGSLELIKALKDFNNMVNDILYNSDTKMIHSEVAEEIRKCSSVNDLISFSKDLTLTDDAQELKIAKGIDKFAEGILEKSYDMIRNL